METLSLLSFLSWKVEFLWRWAVKCEDGEFAEIALTKLLEQTMAEWRGMPDKRKVYNYWFNGEGSEKFRENEIDIVTQIHVSPAAFT